jgi:Fe-S cluster biogenesis protein NfuA
MQEDRLKEVEAVLEKIRPALKDHQGELKVVEIKGGTVYLQFEGGCSDCPVVDVSLKDVVNIAIKGNLEWVDRVEILAPKISIG